MRGAFKCNSRQQSKFYFKWNQLCISSMNHSCFIIYYYTLNYYDATFFLNLDKTSLFSQLGVCASLTAAVSPGRKPFIEHLLECGQTDSQTPSHQGFAAVPHNNDGYSWWQRDKMLYYHAEMPHYCWLRKYQKGSIVAFCFEVKSLN